jgi:hypothetical protein
MQRQEEKRTWNDIIAEVLDDRINRSEETELEFDDFEARIPLSFEEDAERATWRLDGTVTVTVEGERRPLAEWLRFWARYAAEKE